VFIRVRSKGSKGAFMAFTLQRQAAHVLRIYTHQTCI
jgi:hypothetical protein